MTEEQNESLKVLCAQIDKKYGKGSVMKLTDSPSFDPINVVNSGSVSLNMALGIGGYLRGRIVEIFGQESSGKTTLCLHAIANIQKAGGKALFIDAEHSLDTRYAESLGVKIDELLISQPDFGEQALDIVDMFTKSNLIDIIVIDSVAALIPQKELEGEIGDNVIGLHARIMSQAMRKISGVCSKTNTLIIFTNQIRQKIGVMFGSPNVTTGGNALKFYASQRLEVIRTGNLKVGEVIMGNTTKVKVVKNKVAPPKKEALFNIVFGKGIDTDSEIIELAKEDKIIKQSGSWFKYQDNSIAQGIASAIMWLNENPDIKESIYKEILANRGLE